MSKKAEHCIGRPMTFWYGYLADRMMAGAANGVSEQEIENAFQNLLKECSVHPGYYISRRPWWDVLKG